MRCVCVCFYFTSYFVFVHVASGLVWCGLVWFGLLWSALVVPQLSTVQQLVEFVDGDPAKFTLVTTDHRLHIKAPSLDVKQVCTNRSVLFPEPASLDMLTKQEPVNPICMHHSMKLSSAVVMLDELTLAKLCASHDTFVLESIYILYESHD